VIAAGRKEELSMFAHFDLLVVAQQNADFIPALGTL
jgi:hypothetical protein